MKKRILSNGIKYYVVMFAVMSGLACQAQLSTAGDGDFSMDDHIVSTSFFHWYTSDEGQTVGPWMPLEGRENWTGGVEWWKGQVKQAMRANIDVLYVHLIEQLEDQRVNLFKSLFELRAEGYDIPRIAPFLDIMITWLDQKADMSTAEKKQELIAEYVRFYEQYFSVNTDENAASYLAKIDGRPILVTWHMHINTTNLESFTREDLEKGLAERLSDRCPEFKNGIYMITTGLFSTFSFADEKVFLFELHCYHAQAVHEGLTTAMVKPGYWDQNVRTPGFCLPRAGGVNYRSAWEEVLTSPVVKRVYIESWNEYDEGSGIYAGNPDSVYIHPGMENESSDTWSASNDPFEYIKTTAEGARRFNNTPDYDAVILTHDLPSVMQAGKEYTCNVVVRNEGDVLWNKDSNINLYLKGMKPTDNSEAQLSPMNLTKENLEYGGIYRGCPVNFKISIVASEKPGVHNVELGMLHAGESLGDSLSLEITVE